MTASVILAAFTAVSFLAGLAFGYAIPRLPWRRLPAATRPNVIGDFVLPDVDDPRWKRVGLFESSQKDDWGRFQLGKISIDPAHGFVWIDHTDLDNVLPKDAVRRYAKAVGKAYTARLALEAIEKG